METAERQQLRVLHDTQEEYKDLNTLLQQKQIVENQIADLLQQVAGLKRKAAELSSQFSKKIITVRPSIEPTKSKHTVGKTKAQKIIDAIKKDPSLMSRLQDLDLEL